MDIHRGLVGITAAELLDRHTADLDGQVVAGVVFKKAWADPERGVMFCLSEGPSSEAVLAVHAAVGHPADDIFEVPVQA